MSSPLLLTNCINTLLNHPIHFISGPWPHTVPNHRLKINSCCCCGCRNNTCTSAAVNTILAHSTCTRRCTWSSSTNSLSTSLVVWRGSSDSLLLVHATTVSIVSTNQQGPEDHRNQNTFTVLSIHAYQVSHSLVSSSTEAAALGVPLKLFLVRLHFPPSSIPPRIITHNPIGT